MRRPRREPWSFWCVLKCSVNCPIRSLSKAICTSGLPVSLGCVPYWSMRDFLCSLANTCLVHSCLISIVVCDVYRVPRRVVDRKGWPSGKLRKTESPSRERVRTHNAFPFLEHAKFSLSTITDD